MVIGVGGCAEAIRLLPFAAEDLDDHDARQVFLEARAHVPEAVANGVPAFREPSARNASIVLIAMGTLFGTLFFGISFLATRIGIQVDATETKSVIGLLTQSIVGEGTFFYLVQAATAIILVLAAAYARLTE